MQSTTLQVFRSSSSPCTLYKPSNFLHLRTHIPYTAASMFPLVESSSAAASRARASSSAHPPPPPPPSPLTMYPIVHRTGMAACGVATRRTVTVLDTGDRYEVRVQIPCRIRAIVTLGYGRIGGNRGMQIHAVVQESRMRGGGAYVHRPGVRRLFSGGEFTMRFKFPAKVGVPFLRRMELVRSAILFEVPKIPANEPDQPVDEDMPDPEYHVMHFNEP